MYTFVTIPRKIPIFKKYDFSVRKYAASWLGDPSGHLCGQSYWEGASSASP